MRTHTFTPTIRCYSSVISFYVVLFVEWVFDSGEFILKLNASLNNSLCYSATGKRKKLVLNVDLDSVDSFNAFSIERKKATEICEKENIFSVHF